MAVFNKFRVTVADFAAGKHNLGSHALRVMFTNTAPLVTNEVKADLTEIAAGNGYAAGGPSLTVSASGQTAGVYKVVADDLVLVAAGGSIGPFRYAVLYNDTAAGDPLLGWWDRGSALTIADGDSFTLDLSATNGVIQIS